MDGKNEVNGRLIDKQRKEEIIIRISVHMRRQVIYTGIAFQTWFMPQSHISNSQNWVKWYLRNLLSLI